MSASYTWFNENQRLTVEEVADFFDLIDETELNIFGYQKRDGTLVGIKDFFISYHYGAECRYRKSEKKIAQNRFLMFYKDAKWELFKVKELPEWLNKLKDLDNNWRDTTNHDTTTNFIQDDKTVTNDNNTQTETKNTQLGLISGTVDASELNDVNATNLLNYGEKKILGYLDPTSRNRMHQITIDGGTNTFQTVNNSTVKTDNKHNTTHKSTTHFSNTSKDLIDVINLQLPNILENFMDKFNAMFLY